MLKLVLSLVASSILFTSLAHADAPNDFERIPDVTYSDMFASALKAFENNEHKLAFEKYQRLACAGDKSSQAILGRMYLVGQGVARDDIKGYLWFKLAAEYNFSLYRSIVKKIEAALSADQLKATAALYDQLAKSYGMRSTNISCGTRSSSSFSSSMKDALECTPARLGDMLLVHRYLEPESSLVEHQ